MKTYPAIAFIEFRDVPVGIFATDAMVKKSPIALLKSGILSQGRYLTMVGGTTASVDEAYEEGLFWGKDSVLDHVFLPDVHPRVHDAIMGLRQPEGAGAMAILETPTVAGNIRAAELALKGTPVDLMEIRFADAWLAGKGISIYRGELHDIEAAVEIAVAYLQNMNIPVLWRVIAAPHEALTEQLKASTIFFEARPLELEGEED